MKKLIILLLMLSACTSSNYLVTVETAKPIKIEVEKPNDSHLIDSLVISNFGYAIKGFSSDSLFLRSPYFKIETLHKTIYGEKKK